MPMWNREAYYVVEPRDGKPKVFRVETTRLTENMVHVVACEVTNWGRSFEVGEFHRRFSPTVDLALWRWRTKAEHEAREMRREAARLEAMVKAKPAYEVCCKVCSGPVDVVDVEGRPITVHLDYADFYQDEKPNHTAILAG